ncbi:hypothetical protein ZWY2020_014198 [Hordeum vulgare]|nr:hypothetical protein ZWY2020_014198 [Hordeum vulgare]
MVSVGDGDVHHRLSPRHFITLVTVGAANQQQRAFHEIQLSPEKPPTATAFVLHGLLGSGRNWLSRTLASQLMTPPSDDNRH